MNKITRLVAVFSLFTATASFAQNEKVVSDNASLIVCLDGANTQKHMTVSQMEKLDMIKEFKKEISKETGSKVTLKKLGFDYSKRFFMTYERNDSANIVMLYAPLTSNKFILSELMKKERSLGKENGIHWYKDGSDVFGVSKNSIILIDIDLDYTPYKRRLEEYTDENGEVISYYEYRNKIKRKLAKDYAKARFSGKNPSKKLKEEHSQSIYAWGDLKFIDKLFKPEEYREDEQIIKEIQKSFNTEIEQANAFASLDFDENGTIISASSVLSPEMKKMYDNVFNKNINPELLKYIPADAIGYQAYAVNYKGMYESYRELLNSVKTSDDNFNLVKDIWDIVDLIIDEDEIFNTFKGEFVMSFNGIKDVEYTRKKWEYDEYTLESKLTEVTATDKFPTFTTVYGIGNKEIYEKIFKIMAKANKEFSKNEDGSWSLKENELNVQMHITENALIVTNDPDFNWRDANNGLKNSMYKHKEKFNSPIAMYLDIERLGKDIPMDKLSSNDKERVALISKYGESAELLPVKMEGNKVEYQIRINTKGKNGLNSWMNLANDFFKIEQKRREDRAKRYEESMIDDIKEQPAERATDVDEAK